jgi:hypothetical protein
MESQPRITSACPSCGKDVIITGIKLVFDKPDTASYSDPNTVKAEMMRESITKPAETKEYVGWTDVAPSKTIMIDNSAPGADASKMVKEAVKEEPVINKTYVEDTYTAPKTKPEFTQPAAEAPKAYTDEGAPRARIYTQDDVYIPPVEEKRYFKLTEEEVRAIDDIVKSNKPKQDDDVIRKELIPELRTLTQALRDQAKAQEVCILCDRKVTDGGRICDQCLKEQLSEKTEKKQPEEQQKPRKIMVW